MLVVVTLLGLAMMRGFGLLERIAANTRDKQRAFSVAHSTLQYGEWWLTEGLGGTGGPCTGPVTLTGPASMRVCADALADPAALPWSARMDYLPAEVAVSASGGVTPDGRTNHRSPPGLHISYLGFSMDGNAQLYRVSAFATGGKPDTAVVVQSTFEVRSGVKDLGAM